VLLRVCVLSLCSGNWSFWSVNPTVAFSYLDLAVTVTASSSAAPLQLFLRQGTPGTPRENDVSILMYTTGQTYSYRYQSVVASVVQYIAIYAVANTTFTISVTPPNPSVASVSPTLGQTAGGDTITVTGADFGTAGVVYVNNAVCSQVLHN